MADFAFNIPKGKVAYYASLPATNDAIKLLALQSSGIESDATLKDYDTVAAILAGASDEATNTGYSRQTLTTVTVTVDDTNDRVDIDADDLQWSAVQATGGAWAKLVVYYDPDTTASSDANNVPLSAHDFAITPDGNDILATLNSAGWYRSA